MISTRVLLVLVFSSGADIRAADKTTHFIGINGGYSVQSNYGGFRSDLQAFQSGLAGSKGQFFDAGGAGTPYVEMADDGAMKRDAVGNLIFGRRPLGFNVGAARKSEILKAFEKQTLSENPLTTYFGDHGAKEGVCLWGDSTLTSTEWEKLQRTMPPGKLIRSIHSHCFSSAMLANPAKRNPPKDLHLIGNYLAGVYRPNSCGLATASKDEPSSSYSKDKKTFWNKQYEELHPPTLQAIWENLASETGIHSTPSLTSDLVIADIFDALCAPILKGFRKPDAKAEAMGATHDAGKGYAGRPSAAADSICTNETPSNISGNLHAQYLVAAKQYDETMGILGRAVYQVIARKYPSEIDGWSKAQDEIDGLRKNLLLEDAAGNTASGKLKEAENKIERLIAKYRHIDLELEATTGGFKNRELVVAIYKTKEFQDWLHHPESKKQFPVFHELTLPAEDTSDPVQTDILKLIDEYDSKELGLRLAQKADAVRIMRRKRHFVENELKRMANLPEVAKIQKIYDAIRKCENSVLN